MRHTGLDPVSPTSSASSSLRPPSRSPLQVQKVLKLFSPLQFVQLCDSGSQPGMTKEMTAPHPNPPRVGEGIFEYTFPDLGKVGMGSIPQGFYVVVILNSGAKHSVIRNPLHPLPKRHTGWIFGRAMVSESEPSP